MKTFNRDKGLKKELVKQLKYHQKIDAFIQGEWLTNVKAEGNGFKGCFYGCTMQTADEPRKKFSEKYNIPLWYCYLTETIFEGLPQEEAKSFPVESIQILDVGIDLNKVRSKFNYKMLESQLEFCQDRPEVTKCIQQCTELFTVDFHKIDRSAEYAAQSVDYAAQSAAMSAWTAARSAWFAALSAAYATRSAVYVARSAEYAALSAEYAARSAAGSATGAAAGSAYYVKLRDMLFESINECK